jgi:hypothetical protein
VDLDGGRWTITPEGEDEPVGLALLDARRSKPREARTPKAQAAPQVPPSLSPLAAEIAGRIAGLRSEHTGMGDLLADHLGGLLAEVEATDAPDVATFLDRRCAMSA